MQAAVKAGGQEVRLIPGRRIVIVTPAGEREVQGAEQSAATIEQLLGPVITPEARQALGAGRAEWTFSIAGVGPVRGVAETRQGVTTATFAKASADASATASAPAPAAMPMPPP